MWKLSDVSTVKQNIEAVKRRYPERHVRALYAVQRVGAFAVPAVVIRVLFLALLVQPAPDAHDLADFFSGSAAVARAGLERNRKPFEFDIIRHGELENLLHWKGFANALNLVAEMEMGAQASLGIVCTSYSKINKGTHRRSVLKPLGKTSYKHCGGAKNP